LMGVRWLPSPTSWALLPCADGCMPTPPMPKTSAAWHAPTGAGPYAQIAK
jgi:hypothetical protein